ncbi:efflux RND transporter periplasmic adaptor subunit [Mucilaginibacter sp. BT774]|uniref:efflux RND transporter periplasmic adaptor subunit n=1 Tax=Mucilaginibacter sp. BT774 TaxID=3062276 RepID=UPI0026744E49|nr:efflux RND transporter periplasmic adaptor subunit [Mucilaginibacter sp. BT774]MDO3628062.1 efflux RND transporter periplasmic adaptor subunit [Mucilaginibacter sp. BT774]
MRIARYIPYTLLLTLIISCSNVHTIHPVRKDIVETVYASGKVMADSEYTVYALSPGTVVKKLVKEGDAVKKGQLLYVINNTAPAAKLDAANITYEKARENVSSRSRILTDLRLAMQNANIKFRNDSLQYFRLKNLWNQNVGTKSTLDNAETQYHISSNEKKSAQEKYYSTVNDLNISLKNAQSSVASARNDLNNFMIRAESNGTVYQMMKEKGEAVKANEAVVLIGKSTDRLIKLSVDQQDINLVQPGQQVLLKTDATGDKIYNAKVVRVYPTMNEADQTFRVDAIFTGQDAQSYIHTSVEANIVIQKKQQALVIPVKSILNGDSVKVKDGGRIKAVSVKIGIHTLDEAEILEGLTEHSEVVESPSGK